MHFTLMERKFNTTQVYYSFCEQLATFQTISQPFKTAKAKNKSKLIFVNVICFCSWFLWNINVPMNFKLFLQIIVPDHHTNKKSAIWSSRVRFLFSSMSSERFHQFPDFF